MVLAVLVLVCWCWCAAPDPTRIAVNSQGTVDVINTTSTVYKIRLDLYKTNSE
jgi:hypothetical protein